MNDKIFSKFASAAMALSCIFLSMLMLIANLIIAPSPTNLLVRWWVLGSYISFSTCSFLGVLVLGALAGASVKKEKSGIYDQPVRSLALIMISALAAGITHSLALITSVM